MNWREMGGGSIEGGWDGALFVVFSTWGAGVLYFLVVTVSRYAKVPRHRDARLCEALFRGSGSC